MQIDEEIMVSVCMITYNHARFVEQAIQSIVSQKTNFQFELIIHDDASPDGTADIIRQYEKRYPNLIRPVLQTENQYSAGKEIREFYLPLCRGKYFAFCEGDDYWTDEYKLQKQVDYLEAHPEVPAVSGRYYTVDKNNSVLDISHKGEQLDRVFFEKDAVRLNAGTVHPNTIMHRMSVSLSADYNNGVHQCCILGSHTFMIYYLCSHGGIYIMEDIIGAWRKVIEENGTSYASRYAQHPITYNIKLMDMYIRYQSFFGEKYNFSNKISKIAVNTLAVIYKGNEIEISRKEALFQLLKLLSFKEIINIFCYVGKRILNGVLRNGR